MGLHRVIRRYRNQGGAAALRYVWRQQMNRLYRVANLVGPARKRCPCCGWSGMRLLDDASHSQNAIICPGCGSHSRHRALWIFLQNQVALLRPGSAVLHLAADHMVAPLFTGRRDLRYVSIDLKTKLAMVCADATRLPFASGAFDMIVSSHVIEHIGDDRAALAEFARVLGPGGVAITMVPMRRNWKATPTEEYGKADPQREYHWRLYGFDLEQRLREAGFESSTVTAFELTGAELASEYELMDEPIFVGRKSE